MSGVTDLATMLATLDVQVREGRFGYVTRAMHDAALDATAAARIDEAEGVTYVVHVQRLGPQDPGPDFIAAWLTLTVHSSLQAVGLTAAVSHALAAQGIACNVLAGFHNDHLLVPADRIDDAIAALHALRAA